MATWQHELSDAPTEARSRELWLQHAAGFILFEDVRRYALERVDASLPAETRAAVQRGIDDAVYGLMMVIDGVSGGLSNDSCAVQIDFVARLTQREKSGIGSTTLSEIDLQHGDGMCIGYHGWIDADFGEVPVAVPRSIAE